MEGTDDLPYEAIQYQTLASIIEQLMGVYTSIHRSHIVGHMDIAPGRKTDPGPAFDWMHLNKLLDTK